MSTDRKRKLRTWVPLAAVLVAALLIEGLSLVALEILARNAEIEYEPYQYVLSPAQRERLQQFVDTKQGQKTHQDPVLGWIPRTGANSAGMRDDREYEVHPPPGTIRIAAYGDSFTYGSDVELHETWEKQLHDLDPRLEVLNYGAGAYGLDQAYLRYQQLGTQYHPDIVFIGYMSENLARHVNVFRPFYSKAYETSIFTKPRFRLEDGELVLLPNPIPKLEDHQRLLDDPYALQEIGEKDYHYKVGYGPSPFDFLAAVRLVKIFAFQMKSTVRDPIFLRNGMYNRGSEAFQLTTALVDAFHRAVLENGALPIVVIFPDVNDQHRSRAAQQRRYAPLLKHLRRQGYDYIDTMSALEPYNHRHTIQELTRAWGHYSPIGNEIIARYMLEKLEAWGYTSRATVDERIREMRAPAASG